MQILVFVASLLFIWNKVFLLNSKWNVRENVKWSLGLIAAILFIVYFFSIGSPILATLEIGLTVLALYRTIVGKKRNPKVETSLGVFTGTIIAILFLERFTGYIETLQLLGALGMMFGTFLLIRDSRTWGFSVYAIGHLFTTIYGFEKGEFIFWWLQAVQGLLCLTIFLKEDEDSLGFDVRHTAICLVVVIGISIGIVVWMYLNDVG